MTGRRVVIAGASGFIGHYLTRRFRSDGDTVITIGRQNADALWSDPTGLERALNGADLLINLAGKSVNCRYTQKNKRRIMSSRVLTTEALGRAVAAAANPPALWLNASTGDDLPARR